jgi:hypothetical protein
MIYNVNHYRFLLFKKLVENGLWNPDHCYVSINIDGLVYQEGLPNPYYTGTGANTAAPALVAGVTQPPASVRDMIATILSIPNFHEAISVDLSIWGFAVKLSDNGLRGRAPTNVLGSGLRTVLFQRNATRWTSILEGFWVRVRESDTTTFERLLAETMPNIPAGDRSTISGSNVSNYLSHPASESFWTDSVNLTYRSLSEIIATLKNKFVLHYEPFVKIANIILSNNMFDSIFARISSERERVFREQYAEIEAARALARSLELEVFNTYEKRKQEEVLARAQRLKELAEQFSFFAPRRKEIATKSVKNMEDFLSKIPAEIFVSTNTENPLIPAVSLDYANQVTLDLVCNKDGVFIEGIKVPADKLIKLTQMLKGL